MPKSYEPRLSERRRISAARRRELTLDAASLVFGERGYAGATTDAVAKAAGVSQAYVVRAFGSKESLFMETASRACRRIAVAFREAVGVNNQAEDSEESEAEGTSDAKSASASLQERLGRVYVDLVKDRGTLLTVMHLFTLGHHDSIGPLARDEFLEIYRILREELGLGAQDAERFLAKGMLINTVLGLRLPDAVSTELEAKELLDCIFDESAPEIVEFVTGQKPLGQVSRGAF